MHHKQGWELYAALSDFVRCASCFSQFVYIRTALLEMLVHYLVTLSYKPVQQSQTDNRWLHCISAGQCFYNDMRFALRIKARTAAHHSAYNSQPGSKRMGSTSSRRWIDPQIVRPIFLVQQHLVLTDNSSKKFLVRLIILSLYCFAYTIVFKKNGPPTNYKFQIHNIAHASLLEAPVHKMTQWNHINMLYFDKK